VNFIKMLRPKTWLSGAISHSTIVFALLLSLQTSFEKTLLLTLFFAFFESTLASYSYLLNSSIESNDSNEKWLFALAVLTLLFSFLISPVAVAFAITSLLLSTAYSLPPFKLKSKGIFGLIAISLSASALPILMVSFSASFFNLFTFSTALLMGLLQLLFEMPHQISHINEDTKNSEKTFAVKSGRKKAIAFSKILLASFFALLILFQLIFGQLLLSAAFLVVCARTSLIVLRL